MGPQSAQSRGGGEVSSGSFAAYSAPIVATSRPSSAPRSGRRSRPQSAQSRGGGEGSSGLFASSSAPDTREYVVASSAPTVAQFLPGDVKVSTCVRAKVSTRDR